MSVAERLHLALEEQRSPLTAALARLGQLSQPTVGILRDERFSAPPERGAHLALVSVVIPCYNYGHFLAQSVGSVLSQQDVDVEVIIVDDASTDDSAAVADALAAADSRVRVLRNPANSGHVVTFNNGASLARGEFVVRLDADDLLTPGSLTRAVALFAAMPSVGLVYGHPRHFLGTDLPGYREQLRGWTVWSGRDWLAERCRTGVNCITTPEAILRRSVLDDVGLLNTELKYAQDMEMWLRAAAVSDVGHLDGPDQAWHRDHEASMSVTIGSGVLVDLAERRVVFDVLFKAVGHRIEGAAELHAQSRRALAAEALDRACRAYDRGKVEITPVAELVDFALDADPTCTSSRQWSRLERRRRSTNSPVSRAKVRPRALLSAGIRRLSEECAYARWVRTGL